VHVILTYVLGSGKSHVRHVDGAQTGADGQLYVQVCPVLMFVTSIAVSTVEQYWQAASTIEADKASAAKLTITVFRVTLFDANCSQSDLFFILFYLSCLYLCFQSHSTISGSIYRFTMLELRKLPGNFRPVVVSHEPPNGQC